MIGYFVRRREQTKNEAVQQQSIIDPASFTMGYHSSRK